MNNLYESGEVTTSPPRTLSQPIKLMIGTPAYNSLVHTDYLHSILSYTTIPNLLTTVVTIGNTSLLIEARNKIFSLFVSSDFDYLLFLDADVGFPGEQLVRLLNHRKDIIGAPIRLKSPSGRIVFDYVDILDDTNYPLVKVKRKGTAILLISKKLALDLAKWCEKNNEYYYFDSFHSEGHVNHFQNLKIYNVFRLGKKGDVFLGEDYWFCELVRELGYDVWVDLSCVSVHNGFLGLVYSPNNC